MSMQVWRIQKVLHEQRITCISYNPKRREVLTGSEDTTVRAWDIDSGRLARTMAGHRGWVTDIEWIPTLQVVVSSSIDGCLIVWSPHGAILQQTELFSGPIHAVAFHPKHNTLIAGGTGTIVVFKVSRSIPREYFSSSIDPSQQKSKAPMADSGVQILKLACSPLTFHEDICQNIITTQTGRTFAAGYDRIVYYFEAEDAQDVTAFQAGGGGHTAAISSMTVDDETGVVITGSFDATVKVWSSEGRLLDSYEGIGESVQSVCYVPSMRSIWVVGTHRTQVVCSRTGEMITAQVRDMCSLGDVSLSLLRMVPQAGLLMGVSDRRDMVFWRFNPSRPLRLLSQPSAWLECLMVTRPQEGAGLEMVITGTSDGRLLVWSEDADRSGQLTLMVREELWMCKRNILCCTYAMDIGVFIGGAEDGRIHAYSWYKHTRGKGGTGGEQLALTLEGHNDRCTGVAYIGQKRVASVSSDCTLRIWDLDVAAEVCCVEMKDDAITLTGVQYIPEREELLVMGASAVVLVMSSVSLKTKYWLVGHTAEVTQCQWSKSLNGFVSTSDDETVRAWSFDESMREQFERRSANEDDEDHHSEESDEEETRESLVHVDDKNVGLAASKFKAFTKVAAKKREDERRSNASSPSPMGRHASQRRRAPALARIMRNLSFTAMNSLECEPPEIVGIRTTTGGGVSAMYVDDEQGYVVLCMLDKCVRVYTLKGLEIFAKLQGHDDSIRGVGVLRGLNCYVSCAWDGALMLWNTAPVLRDIQRRDRKQVAMSKPAREEDMPQQRKPGIVDSDDEDHREFKSAYEAANPIYMPESLKAGRRNRGGWANNNIAIDSFVDDETAAASKDDELPRTALAAQLAAVEQQLLVKLWGREPPQESEREKVRDLIVGAKETPEGGVVLPDGGELQRWKAKQRKRHEVHAHRHLEQLARGGGGGGS
ncbi:unnamed protein product [Pedinophyceae sp. YPF-701]|nr:unnamed protein product [Pedinophyceae sp. YPF-701]